MPFFTLSDGSELLLETCDFPEPTYDDLPENPYKHGSKQFNKFHTVSLANYYRKLYRQRVKAEENRIQLEGLPDPTQAIKDPELWQTYLRSKGLLREPAKCHRFDGNKHYPRKYNPTAKKKPKRSDQMRKLLENNGITLVEKESPNGVWMDFYLEQYPEYQFLPNGRLRCGSETISVHHFLQNLVAR